MIFGYTLEQASKAVIAFIGAAILLAAFFIHFPVGFDQALAVVVAQVFGVIAVFMTKNHTADDLGKAVSQLIAAVVALVALFETVNPDTTEKLIAIVSELVVVYAVYRARNAPVPRHT